MKKILVIAQFTQLPGETGNNRSRFRYICELLSASGYDVTEVTSRFRDIDKTHRVVNGNDFKDCSYKIEILEDPGYFKTVSLKRIYSQNIFARNLAKWLNKQSPFDLIYCGTPPAAGTLVAGRYVRAHNIPLVIDVQDLWPEAIRTIFDIPVLSDIILYPVKNQMDKAYSMARGIVAVSQTYARRAGEVNDKNAELLPVFIGTDLEKFDKLSQQMMKEISKPEEEFWVTYTGSLNYSYDIITLMEAIKLLNNEGKKDIRLIILGSGILEDRFKKHAEILGVRVTFTGWVEYGTMAAYLKKSDVLVNAIKKKAAQSITNKIGDYVSAGVPIVNGSMNAEFRAMVESYNIGYNYEPENVHSMAESIKKVYTDTLEQRKKMSINARKLSEEKFDRKNTYVNIVKLVDRLIAR